jgi:hypothetical protein
LTQSKKSGTCWQITLWVIRGPRAWHSADRSRQGKKPDFETRIVKLAWQQILWSPLKEVASRPRLK